MTIPTYTLTVDLAEITGRDAPNVTVEIGMADPRLVYPLGAPARTLFPTTLSATTNAQGIATFTLLPSSVTGLYVVTIGGFPRTISMPDEDTRLSQLPDVVMPDEPDA